MVSEECSECPVFISSKTFAKTPGLRSRTTIGVGEEVRIYLSGADPFVCSFPSWELDKPDGDIGMISSESGYEVIFIAGVVEGESTVTAKFPAACGIFGCPLTQSITFNVIAPTEWFFKKKEFEPVEGVTCSDLHVYNRPSAGFRADMYILPDNVNFYNIQTKEGEVGATLAENSPYFEGLSLPSHGVAEGCCVWTLNTSEVIEGMGTKVDEDDDVWFHSVCPDVRSPTLSGTITYPIPIEYARNDRLDFVKTLMPLNQVHSNIGTTQSFMSSKVNASATVQLLTSGLCAPVSLPPCE